jgi:hypothetical protein
MDKSGKRQKRVRDFLSKQVSQDRLNMRLCAIDMREIRVSFVKNHGEVRSRQHYRINRQFVCDARQDGPPFSFTSDGLHVCLVNCLHLIGYNHFHSVEHAEHA